MFALYKYTERKLKGSSETKSKSKAQLCEHQQRGLSDIAAAPHEQTAIVVPKPEVAGLHQIDYDGLKQNDSSEKDPAPNVSQAAAVAKESCSTCRAERIAARKYRWKLIGGLFLPFALQALDGTIIASALPFIASDFHELSQLNWIVTSFNLTSAAFIPAWGQFADIFGRHAALQTSLIIMLIGSAMCAGSPTSAFPLLLTGRALQGVASAGINILTKVVLADKVSLKENAKNNSIFSLVGGLSYGVGPVLGGVLTQVSWRWCFIINLPIALFGMVVTFWLLRTELLGPQKITGVDDAGAPLENSTGHITRFMARLATVDFGGQLLFLFGMGLLILALTWGGSSYAWSDAHVLAPLVIGAVLLCAFILWEYLMVSGRVLALRYPKQKAMIPFKLMWSRNAGLLCYINFITGMALFSVFYFVSLYFALVKKYAPSKAGIQLLFYTPGIGVGIYLAMFLCNIYPRKTWYPIFAGTIAEPLGITLLALFIGRSNSHVGYIFGMLALSGFGTGLRFMPGTLHGVGYYRANIASIVSLMSLAISLGGILGLTIMFTIFNNYLLSHGINLHTSGASSASSFQEISSMTPEAQDYLRETARGGIKVAMWAMTSFLWLGIAAVAALGNVDITKDKADEVEIDEGSGLIAKKNVCQGSYLGSLMTKRTGRGLVATEKGTAEINGGIVHEP